MTTDSRKLTQERRAKLLYVGSKEDQALITSILDELDAALDERDDIRQTAWNMATHRSGQIDELSRMIARLQAENERREQQIASLFAAIAHGDEKHREWLKAKIDEHFALKENYGKQ